MARSTSWFRFLLFFLVLAAVLWLATAWMNRVFLGGGGARLSGSNVLEVDLIGPIVERPQHLFGSRAYGPLAVREIDRALRRAADDERIAGVLLRLGPTMAGFGKAQEIRSAVQAFADSGKPVTAIIGLGTILDLYVATAADRVVQLPNGSLLLGLASRTRYYRELLDRLGIEFEAFHTGPYKSAMNPYTETGMSDEERMVVESLLDSLYGQLVDGLASDRDMSAQAVRDAIDLALLSAGEARDSGLVDDLAFLDEVIADMDAPGGRVSVRDYWAAAGGGGWSLAAPVTALIHVDGMLVPGQADGGLLQSGLVGGDTVAAAIRQARRAPDVRAIVLRVNSPGGEVTASDAIWRETLLAAEGKPVILSMSDVAASGGYWIATAATRVLANPATYTGSIGVVASRYNLVGAYEKLGIGNEVITRGRNADMFVDSRSLSPEQSERFQSSIETTYRAFIARVAAARELTVEEVERLAAGRVWTGEQAVEIGLVDELGGLRAALSAARRAAGLEAGRHVEIRVYPRPRTLFEQVTGFLVSARARDRAIEAGLQPFDPGGPLAADVRLRLLRRLNTAGTVWALLDTPVPLPLR